MTLRYTSWFIWILDNGSLNFATENWVEYHPLYKTTNQPMVLDHTPHMGFPWFSPRDFIACNTGLVRAGMIGGRSGGSKPSSSSTGGNAPKMTNFWVVKKQMIQTMHWVYHNGSLFCFRKVFQNYHTTPAKEPCQKEISSSNFQPSIFRGYFHYKYCLANNCVRSILIYIYHCIP